MRLCFLRILERLISICMLSCMLCPSLNSPTLIMLLLGKAREGDVHAARMLLVRVVPNLKAEEPTVQVDVPADVGLADTGRAVIRAAIEGVLPLGQAAALVGAVRAVARLVEVDELIRRVEGLEGKGRAGT